MDETAFKKQIGSKIKQLRTIKGWSRQQAADELDISVTSYGSIERGETDVSVTRLAQVAEIFEINLSDLLGLTEKAVFNLTKTCNKECLVGLVIVGVGPVSNNLNDPSPKHESEKFSLIQQAQEKEIENLKQQIAQLQEIIALMKKNYIEPM